MSDKRTIVGKFIHTTWTNLNVRCSNGKYRQDTPKNKTYSNVVLLFSRSEFKTWCWEQQGLIESLDRPSLDRIDSTGNYTIDNIQIVELQHNTAKDKLTFTAAHGLCYSCKEMKSIDEFARDKRRVTTGRTTICKRCDSERGCRRYRSRNG